MLPLFALSLLGPSIREDLDVSSAMFGALSSVLFLAGALVSRFAGRLVDLAGTTVGFTVLYGTAITSWLLLAAAAHPAQAFAGLALGGVALALSVPSVTRLLFGVFRDRALGVAIGTAHAGTQVGGVVLGALMPIMTATFGWRSSLRMCVLVPAIGLILTFAMVKPKARPVAPRLPQPIWPEQAVAPRAHYLPRLGMFALLTNGVATAGTLYLITFAHEAVGVTLVVTGLMMSVMALSSIVGKVLWGAAAASPGGKRTLNLLVVTSCAAVVILASATMTGTVALWLGAVLFGATATTWAVPATRLAGIIGGPRNAGKSTGWVMVAGYLGGAVGPPLYGQVIDIGGFPSAWASLLLMLALAGLVVRRLT